MNGKKLQRLAEKRGFSKEGLAEELGMDSEAFERKLRGEEEFLLWEIRKLIKILFLSRRDAANIFFEEKVSFRKQKGKRGV